MRFLITAAAALALCGSPASAQIGPIDDILNDIFQGGNQPSPAYGLIETIPVNVDIGTLRNLHGNSLIINAYKPVQPGMTQPQLIGQTRILLTGLPPQLGLAISVPEPVTKDLDYAVINAVILNEQDQEVMFSQKDEFYRGRGNVQLVMHAPGQSHVPTQSPQGNNVETLKGKVTLPRNTPELTRGASLTVELVEQDGAGVTTILGQTFIDVDQEKPPFKFRLDYVSTTPTSGQRRFLRAHITDWAGRRMYESRADEPYRGEDDDYRVLAEPLNIP